MKRTIRLAISMVAFAGLLSCGGEKDVDKIGNAQFCLDKLDTTPTSAEIDKCLQEIDGLTSPGANSIRCSAGFIREGFGSGRRFIKAFEAIDEGAGGTSGSNTQELMGILSFTAAQDIDDDYNSIVSTFQACLNSGGKGSTLLSSFSYLTMGLMKYLVNVGGGACTATPTTYPGTNYLYYDLSACVTAVAGSGSAAELIKLGDPNEPDAEETQSGLGSVIIATYTVSCTGSGANKDLCAVIGDAVTEAGGTGNPRLVAVEFFKSLLGI